MSQPIRKIFVPLEILYSPPLNLCSTPVNTSSASMNTSSRPVNIKSTTNKFHSALCLEKNITHKGLKQARTEFESFDSDDVSLSYCSLFSFRTSSINTIEDMVFIFAVCNIRNPTIYGIYSYFCG